MSFKYTTAHKSIPLLHYGLWRQLHRLSGCFVGVGVGRERDMIVLLPAASRMESNSQAMQIHISETTRRRLGSQYRTTERGGIHVKGKGQCRGVPPDTVTGSGTGAASMGYPVHCSDNLGSRCFILIRSMDLTC